MVFKGDPEGFSKGDGGDAGQEDMMGLSPAGPGGLRPDEGLQRCGRKLQHNERLVPPVPKVKQNVRRRELF